jgi:gamma-glutamyltranspeptidase/glutathione hydrolase
MERATPSSEVKPADYKTLQQFTSNSADPQLLQYLFRQQSLGKRRVRNSLPLAARKKKLGVGFYATRYESPQTSHLTVVDEQRNAVSLTFTLNYGFGSGVVVPGTGILMNDEMDDFAAAPGVPNVFGLVETEANAIPLASALCAIAPRKTPLSSMTPTIVTENGHLRVAVGAPSGGNIITQVLQILLNVLEYKMDAGMAVSAPRIHHQWLPDELRVEPFGLEALTLAELQRRGHRIKQTKPWGNVNSIVVTPDGTLEGAADPRGEGSPRGL